MDSRVGRGVPLGDPRQGPSRCEGSIGARFSSPRVISVRLGRRAGLEFGGEAERPGRHGLVGGGDARMLRDGGGG